MQNFLNGEDLASTQRAAIVLGRSQNQVRRAVAYKMLTHVRVGHQVLIHFNDPFREAPGMTYRNFMRKAVAHV